MQHLLMILLIGLLAGWLAGKLMKSRERSLIANLIVGLIGSVLGGFLFTLLGLGEVNLMGSLVTATVGAAALLWLLDYLNRR